MSQDDILKIATPVSCDTGDVITISPVSVSVSVSAPSIFSDEELDELALGLANRSILAQVEFEKARGIVNTIAEMIELLETKRLS